MFYCKFTMKHPDSIIPPNHKGAYTDTVSTEEFTNSDEARSHYLTVKNRLLLVNKWHEYAGSATADFQLISPQGIAKTSEAGEGDYFKIDIPAPGSEAGDGYDWVRVEQIEESSDPEEDWEYTLIRVKPSSPPDKDSNDTAHFFSDDASSYFLAKRIGKVVSAEVHGRNEHPNTDSDSITDKIRNTIVAIGAMIGISKAQWKSLVNGLVKI